MTLTLKQAKRLVIQAALDYVAEAKKEHWTFTLGSKPWAIVRAVEIMESLKEEVGSADQSAS
jgi:hypothetical protein